MRCRSSMSRWLMLGLPFAALLLVLTSTPASATPGPNHFPVPHVSPHPKGVVIHARMTLHCEKLNPAALAYAVVHNYCPGNASAPEPAGVHPASGAQGNCGDSWLSIWDDGINEGQGHTGFYFGAHSDLGAMSVLTYSVDWVNFSNNFSGNISDTVFPWDATWERRTSDFTTSGEVGAVLNGGAELVWGAPCEFEAPADITYVQ